MAEAIAPTGNVQATAAYRIGPASTAYSSNAVSGTASTITYATLGLDPQRIWAFQPIGGDVNIMCNSSSGTTATTTNGIKITDGSVEEMYPPPGTDRISVIGSATCSLNIWEASK